MEITGRIFDVLPVQTGLGKNGEWKKQGYVLMTTDENPRYFYFEVFDGKESKLARYNIQKDGEYTVFFDVRAHEYGGRWYNTIIVKDVRQTQNKAAQTENI